MAKYTIAVPTAEDVAVANKLAGYPRLGVNAATGLPVQVAPGWEARALAGNPDPGVSLYRITPLEDGTPVLRVLDEVVTALKPENRDETTKDVDAVALAAFEVKLAAAPVVGVVVEAEMEILP